jgi:hypothetical protein
MFCFCKCRLLVCRVCCRSPCPGSNTNSHSSDTGSHDDAEALLALCDSTSTSPDAPITSLPLNVSLSLSALTASGGMATSPPTASSQPFAFVYAANGAAPGAVSASAAPAGVTTAQLAQYPASASAMPLPSAPTVVHISPPGLSAVLGYTTAQEKKPKVHYHKA